MASPCGDKHHWVKGRCGTCGARQCVASLASSRGPGVRCAKGIEDSAGDRCRYHIKPAPPVVAPVVPTTIHLTGSPEAWYTFT